MAKQDYSTNGINSYTAGRASNDNGQYLGGRRGLTDARSKALSHRGRVVSRAQVEEDLTNAKFADKATYRKYRKAMGLSQG